jgi:hypothetical protein
MDALLTDRTEQEADKTSMPTRSHHQEIGADSRTNEDLGGGALDDLALDLDAFDPTNNVSDGLLEDVLCRLL